MDNTKYLSDGRKVVVIGTLNQQETIVQEVFVTPSGDEIPDGERFVVKSLHDEPVKSWHVKAKEDAEKAVARLKKEIGDLNQKRKDAKRKLHDVESVLRSSKRLAELFPNADLNTLTMVMSGTAKWVVRDNYCFEKPIRFMDAIASDREEWGIEEVKLISVMGKSNGDLTYNINRYSDGSGGWQKAQFFRTWEEAIEVVRERAEQRIREGKFGPGQYKVCKEIGIQLSPEALSLFRNRLADLHAKAEAARQEKHAEADAKAAQELALIAELDKEVE